MIAFVALGANMKNALDNILQAGRIIAQSERDAVFSNIYITKPISDIEQNDYFNAVMRFETDKPAKDLLLYLHSIENLYNRERLIKWGPRTLDLDLIFYEQEISNDPKILLPHPFAYKRAFVLIPLLDIENKLHPILNITAQDALFSLSQKEKEEVKIFSDWIEKSI